MQSIAIALDGPSGAGKSTVGRAVAAKLSYIYVDTGAIYRSIGLYIRRRGIAGNDSAAIIAALPDIHITLSCQKGAQYVILNGETIADQIRTQEIAQYASDVSAIPEVRQFLLDLQRNIANTENVLMDGRDIGTVVLPDAQIKIFLTASVEKRAERRYKELLARGQSAQLEQIQQEIAMRDQQDMNRTVAPLRQADDAVLLDTSALTLEESIAAVLRIVSEKLQAL